MFTVMNCTVYFKKVQTNAISVNRYLFIEISHKRLASRREEVIASISVI